MTNDFLVKFIRNGVTSLEAFSCKTASDLENLRVLEKLELERIYFDSLGVPHRLVIDSELPITRSGTSHGFAELYLDDNGWAEHPAAMAEHGRRMTYELSRAPSRGSSGPVLCKFLTHVLARHRVPDSCCPRLALGRHSTY